MVPGEPEDKCFDNLWREHGHQPWRFAVPHRFRVDQQSTASRLEVCRRPVMCRRIMSLHPRGDRSRLGEVVTIATENLSGCFRDAPSVGGDSLGWDAPDSIELVAFCRGLSGAGPPRIIEEVL